MHNEIIAIYNFDRIEFIKEFKESFNNMLNSGLADSYTKGYLIKKDSIAEKMLRDFNSIKTDYFEKKFKNVDFDKTLKRQLETGKYILEQKK